MLSLLPIVANARLDGAAGGFRVAALLERPRRR